MAINVFFYSVCLYNSGKNFFWMAYFRKFSYSWYYVSFSGQACPENSARGCPTSSDEPQGICLLWRTITFNKIYCCC